MRLNLPIRLRLTLLYCLVLGLSFIAFFYICDLGFRHSIETTVNEASRSNLEIVRRLLSNAAPSGEQYVQKELKELSELWANGALLEVTDASSTRLFQSAQFREADPPLPRANAGPMLFATTNLRALQYRVATEIVEAGRTRYEVRVAVPTEPFDQALDSFRLIERKHCRR